LAHQIVVHCLGLSNALLQVEGITLINELQRRLAEQQPADLNVVFVSTIGIN
jgi:hypothetical protein